VTLFTTEGNQDLASHPNPSITRSIAGCLRFFTLIQYFDLPLDRGDRDDSSAFGG
jgi:hypothetical protein